MKKTKGALALLLGVALAAAPMVSAAYADDLPPEDVAIEAPAAPAVEVPEVTPEVTPDTPVEEVPAPAPAPVAAIASKPKPPEPEKLPICHSGSGKTWVYIAPDAQGYNGHQHHDADIIGLSEVDCLAKNPPVDETPFVLIAWPMASWIDDHTPTWPQGVAAGLAAPLTADLATRNLDALDDTLAALTVPCETSVQFQVDGNFDTAEVRAAIAGGSLYGPGDPAEALWGGGWGEAYKLVKVDGPECEPPVTNTICEVYGDGGTSTDLNDQWFNVDTRSAGHAEYVNDALRVYTDTGTTGSPDPRKVSEGFATTFPLSQTGQLDVDATPNPGNIYPYGPGLNLFVNFGADGNGTLVFEEVYGQDLWLTNGSSAAVKANAPSTTGGNGSQWHGTIDQWLSVYPDAQVIGVAYALGSGVDGDWNIHSLTFNCLTHKFDLVDQPTVPEPKIEVTYTEYEGPEPTCDVEDTEQNEAETEWSRTKTTTITPYKLIVVDGEYQVVEDTENITVTTETEYETHTFEGECLITEEPPTEEPPASTPPTPQGLAYSGYDTGLMIAGVLAVLGGLAFLIFGFRRRSAE